MSIFTSPRFFPRVLGADAASCAATGTLQVVATDTLARLTGLPPALLMATGVFLLAYAAVAALMARRPRPPRALIGVVVAGNLAWAAACVALLASGVFPLTSLGIAWVLVQALCVAVLAELQWTGLWRTRAGAHMVPA